MRLEKALKKVSKKIWNELEPIKATNVKIHQVREEALSTIGLKILAKSNCSNILRIEMISAQEESSKGYDYEICIGNAQKRKFVRFFIQAKRLYGSKLNSRYNKYDAKQSEKFENYAKRYKGIPLYALYNYLDVSESDLKRHYNCEDNFDKKHLGVTLATTTKLKGSNRFDEIHDNGISNYYRIPFYRYHPLNIDFYEDHLQVGVPLHLLANFTIEKAEEFNKIHRVNKSKSILPFFFFFFDTGLFDDDEFIPIIRESEEELIENFKKRVEIKNNIESFNPRVLIIIEQESSYEV
ncbi:hypothetical protein HX052_15235 [Myroides marinus]|uniref:DUF6615 family protein n=1 Tax=Myroides TaxID=76831 RepID=UPI002577C449|nr:MULTISPECIES: DUF6615 family protein [Myroides]MDM1391302.1 hypothetical protein [Myroides marinus]MDM1452516.1 hypothetical protein [Myroides odoratimimus]MDM1455764.1 hypothetical protein [Myroides odoratimimus]MDM1476241.1 hypothetical protein [Myroides odoratimimus]MDM1488768.1 hypothetical protein [Myroides odoratimimus]